LQTTLLALFQLSQVRIKKPIKWFKAVKKRTQQATQQKKNAVDMKASQRGWVKSGRIVGGGW